MWDVILQMPYQKGKSMIKAFRQCREYSSVPSCLIVSGTQKQKIIPRSRENSSVLKRKSRYWMHSGIGWINNAQTREPVWRKRWTMPKIGKTPWWPIWKTVTVVFLIISVRMQSDHLQLVEKTGCSVPVLREPLPVPLCILWLRWRKTNDLNTYKYLTYLLSQRPNGKMSNEHVVDLINYQNTDLLACLWIDLYTVISIQKGKGLRAPS